MCIVIEERRVKAARKDHECMASLYLSNDGCWSDFTFTFAEWRAVAKAKQQNWKILKGQPYIRQRNKDSSDIWTYKAIPEIHAICLKYEIFDC